MYEVLLGRQARKDVRNLPKDVQKRIVDALRELPTEPRPTGSRKLSGSEDDHRVRVGRYRILYTIDDTEKKTQEFRIMHRRDAYRLLL